MWGRSRDASLRLREAGIWLDSAANPLIWDEFPKVDDPLSRTQTYPLLQMTQLHAAKHKNRHQGARYTLQVLLELPTIDAFAVP